MLKDTKFWDWCQEVRALNIVLHGSDFHLSETTLRNQLEAALEANLCTYCFCKKINKITVLKDWVLTIKAVDEKLKDDRKCAYKIVSKENQRNAKRPALSNTSHANINNSYTGSSADTAIPKPPKFEDNEHVLLVKHNSCFCCRQFNQNHSSYNCLNSHPNGSSYKKLTAFCDTAGNGPKATAKTAQNATSSSKGKGGKAVTSVAPAKDNTDSLDKEEDFISLVMLNTALGTSPSSEDDVSKQPLCSKYYTAKFKLFAKDLDFALTFAALINNGAHVILICPEVVKELKLKTFCLPHPETVTVAIAAGSKKRRITLTNYVKFTVTTLDNTWTSCTVHAIIAPGLCMSIILGLPFLEHNKIVADYADCSCIDKKTGYNILNPLEIVPPLLPPPPSSPKLREQAHFLKNAKKLALCELLLVCKQCVHDKKLHFEDIKDVNVVASIRDAIESIAFKEKLRKKADKVKKDF